MAPIQDHFEVPIIQRLHAYWQSLAGGGVPERRQVDPAAIRQLLPYLCLVDFEADPFRVYYRLSGTKVDEFNGFNLTGTYLDQLLKDDPTGGAAHILDYYRRCWETGAPCFSSYLWPTRSGGHLTVQFAMFPLKVAGVIRQAIGIEDWEHSFEPIATEAVPLPAGKNKTSE